MSNIIETTTNDNEKIIILNSSVFLEKKKDKKELYKLYIKNKQICNLHSEIEFLLVEHCNLNCKQCERFSSFSDIKYETIENFTKLITRLHYLFPDIWKISLMGGEPLLHPDILEFCRIARYIFPNSYVVLFTNGILLPEKNIEFYKKLKEYDITLRVSKYLYSNFDINYVLDTCKKVNSKLEIIFKDTLQSLMLMDKNSNYCSKASIPKLMCMQLSSNGNLYTCPVVANCNKFNTNFKVMENKDFINIYKNNNIDIFNFSLTNPVFCEYCYNKNVYNY